MSISKEMERIWMQQFKIGGLIGQKKYPLKNSSVLTNNGNSFPIMLEAAQSRKNRASKISTLENPLARHYFLADYDDLFYKVESTASEINTYTYFINLHETYPLSISLPIFLTGSDSKVMEFLWTPNAAALGPYSSLIIASPIKKNGISTVARQVPLKYNPNIMFYLDSIAELLSDENDLIFYNNSAGFSQLVHHYQVVKISPPFFQYQATKFSYDKYKNCVLPIGTDDWFQPGLLCRYKNLTDVIKTLEEKITAYLRDEDGKGNKFNIILHQNKHCKELFFSFRHNNQDKIFFRQHDQRMNIASLEVSGILPIEDDYVFKSPGSIELI